MKEKGVDVRKMTDEELDIAIEERLDDDAYLMRLDRSDPIVAEFWRRISKVEQPADLKTMSDFQIMASLEMKYGENYLDDKTAQSDPLYAEFFNHGLVTTAR